MGVELIGDGVFDDDKLEVNSELFLSNDFLLNTQGTSIQIQDIHINQSKLMQRVIIN